MVTIFYFDHMTGENREYITKNHITAFIKNVARAGAGGTPLYGLYRYVPRNRLRFLKLLDP